MKGSSVVLGLKSFADKLHAQLPLSQRESSRLLTALTGSFRKHLDEVHPTRAHEEDAPKKAAAVRSVSRNPAVQSSATLADRHLSSVLTSSFFTRESGSKRLTKEERDLALAKRELESDSARDPISLLEEYHQNGKATIPIANLCLQAFDVSVKNLTPEMRQASLGSIHPARRTLLWILGNQIYQTLEFTDFPGFKQLLTYLAMDEGLERQLWSLLESDKGLSLSEVKINPESDPTGEKTMARQYKWKGVVLSGMVHYNAVSPKLSTIDDAIDVVLKAHELRQSAPPNNHMAALPIKTAMWRVYLAITRFLKFPKGLSNPERYDQFLRVCATLPIHGSLGSISDQFCKTDLLLCHPTRPRIEPALQFWKQAAASRDFPSLGGREDEPAKWFKQYFSLEGAERKMQCYSSLMWLVYHLQNEGRRKDAEWAMSTIDRLCPMPVTYSERSLKKIEGLSKLRNPAPKESHSTPPAVEIKPRIANVTHKARNTRDSSEPSDSTRFASWSMDLPR